MKGEVYNRSHSSIPRIFFNLFLLINEFTSKKNHFNVLMVLGNKNLHGMFQIIQFILFLKQSFKISYFIFLQIFNQLLWFALIEQFCMVRFNLQ
jgi:sulfatase maturation enzyme AslB (radical SAM superfamily)